MYTMYLEDDSTTPTIGETFYSPLNTSDGVVVLNPVINFSVNQADTLEFVVPPSNYAYSHFRKMTSIVYVYDHGRLNNMGRPTLVFKGRVVHDEVDFYLQKRIYCESEIAYLKDCILSPNHFKGTIADVFRSFMDEYNRRMSESSSEFLVKSPIDKTFKIGTIDVGTSNLTAEYSEAKNWTNLYDAMKSTLIDNFGGYFRVRYNEFNYSDRTIDYVSRYGKDSNQEIVFGTNMLDFSQYISTENLFTCLVPLGHEDGDDIVRIYDADITVGGKKVHNMLDFIYDGTAVQKFGRIYQTKQWSEIEDPDQLYQVAAAYMQNYLSMSVTLTVKAVDLSLLGVNYERFHIGDRVRVISKPHGIDAYFVCSTLNLDLTQPENSEYTFGYSFSAMTDEELDEKKDLHCKFLYAKSLANNAKVAAKAAQKTADQAINDAAAAQSTADSALSAAGAAQGTANDALGKAEEALRRIEGLGV